MVVGCIPESNNKILLCRRAIEPRFGKWTLPAGYMENGETVSECAKREALEEALARVEDLRPYALLNLPFINQVYFIFRAQLANHDYQAGSESLEVDGSGDRGVSFSHGGRRPANVGRRCRSVKEYGWSQVRIKLPQKRSGLLKLLRPKQT
jgi:ADP-ribose pyrophosphatase YjhB (NUDIX family)